MKDPLKNGLPSLCIWVLVMALPMTEGMRPIAPVKKLVAAGMIASTIVIQKPIVLASNEVNGVGDTFQTVTGEKGPVPESASSPDTDNKDPSAEPETAPLHPFRPSEKIAAEQAVDFPVDI